MWVLTVTPWLSRVYFWSLLGTPANAVLTQIWIALCVYLLVTFLNFKARLGCSLQQILRLLQLNLFARRYPARHEWTPG
jgi:hypothetical protein